MTTTAPLTGLLLADGRITRATITRQPAQPQYQAIQQALHVHTFDVLGLPNGIDLYIDDEGAINGSPLNLAATVLAHTLGTPAVLFGPALVLTVGSVGDTISLSPDQTRTVEDALTVPSRDVLAAVAATLGTAGVRIPY